MKVGRVVEVQHEGNWIVGKVVDVEDGVWVKPLDWGGACRFNDVREYADTDNNKVTGEMEESFSDFGDPHEIAQFEVGKRIEVLYEDEWFPGTILDYQGCSLFTVGFDKGEIAPDVHVSTIREIIEGGAWSRHIDCTSNTPFFCNNETKQTTWQIPTA
eukprot:TRINITY_DN8869_c0_g1_i1.p1 TRINITY_DN8869_c0_g1~~TRINITY_DN8869_c0_g1_i1.p1  ORF type:complete len:158 (+),score=28.30 TRINITY_DN8869_c0_g1_i1:413-886(+)